MNLAELAEALTWRDAVDTVLVAIIVYQLLLLIRGTRAAQVLLGIVVLVGFGLIARALELRSLESLLEQAKTLVPFAVIVLFQNQIRPQARPIPLEAPVTNATLSWNLIRPI